MEFPILPSKASTLAGEVDLLYFALVGLTAFFMILIFGAMFWWLFKYRKGRQIDRTMPTTPTLSIEIAWTVIPFVLAMGFFFWSAKVYLKMQQMPENAMEVTVLGKQWMWKIQHPEGISEINELHIPLGRMVKAVLSSQDVIHSFFIPAFRVKKDAVPGRYTTLWFKPTKVGTYHLFCAEYCGAGHSRMVGRIIVMKPSEFEEWLSKGTPTETLTDKGARLFRDLGCSGCHMGSTVARAPRLEGVYQNPVPLQNSEIVIADDKYIRDSIVFPQLQIAAGYEPIMPTFDGYLGEDELIALVAYIRSLANKAPEGGTPINVTTNNYE